MITGCEKDNTCDQPATKKDIDYVFLLGMCILGGVTALVFNAVSKAR